MSEAKPKLLPTITHPRQLRQLSDAQLVALSEELRERIIAVVSNRGGHLASNLGVTDLTVALHTVFDFDRDRLLWDVGHQCYAHKLLTGRAEGFEHLRTADGISGFPNPAESSFDLFATGHAGSAISTACGLAWADKAANRDTRVVAVVGDASIVNGLSFEGINNAAMLKRQFLIVLNDNSMAIDRTTGALAHALDRLRLTSTYTDLKEQTSQLLQRMPGGGGISEALRHLKAGLKTTIHGDKIFEALGFEYFGPIDGHNMAELLAMLRKLATLNRPAILHVHTQKGRGCDYAVEDPCRFHSPSAYTVHNGQAVFTPAEQPTWTKVFSGVLTDLARKNPALVAVTAAMPDGTGLVSFRKEFPARYFDVGISESHAVAMAAGLAKGGLRPVVAIYSTFMHRSLDQVFQELCLQNLPVVLCMDRAGLVGSDGAVHHGFMDVSMLRPLPGIVLMAPADGAELKAAMEFALTLEGPSALRYPRDEVSIELPAPCPPFELGKARIVRAGNDANILCYGTMVEPALEAADTLRKSDSLSVGIVNARFAKPLDVALISRLISSDKPLLVCEDHAIAGGFGSAVLELAAARNLDTTRIRLIGLPDRFLHHASRQQQLAGAGLDAPALAATVKDMIRAAAQKTVD